MSDILCAKCGEPWDAYGVDHGDMEQHDAEKFHKGQGCPACGFGNRCPSCSGSGWQSIGKCTCSSGKILCRKDPRTKKWMIGYGNNFREAPDTPQVRSESGFVCKDGYVQQEWRQCPDCWGKEPCNICGGDGKLHCKIEDLDLEAARSAVEASDEDPMKILQMRDLLDV